MRLSSQTLLFFYKKAQMITYSHPINLSQIQQMLDLQRLNLPTNISKAEAIEQGFVTVRHDAQLLEEMNQKKPHVIALAGEEVVGYALVMTVDFKARIPVLVPMFDLIDTLSYENKPMSDYKYFTMGQVCIDKNYRGQGIFKGMYEKMKEQYSADYNFVITEVAARNKRSLRAHEKVGFKNLLQYSTKEEEWVLVIWDWK